MPVNHNNIVEGTRERDRRAAVGRVYPERSEKGLVLLAVLQSIPLFVWAAPLVLLFGFLLLALWYQHDTLSAFVSGVLLWASRALIAAGVVLVVAALWKCY